MYLRVEAQLAGASAVVRLLREIRGAQILRQARRAEPLWCARAWKLNFRVHLRVEIQFAEEGAAVRLLLFVLFARVAPNNYSLVVGADFFDTRWHLARRQEITACSTHAAMYFRARFSRVSTRNAQRERVRIIFLERSGPKMLGNAYRVCP